MELLKACLLHTDGPRTVVEGDVGLPVRRCDYAVLIAEAILNQRGEIPGAVEYSFGPSSAYEYRDECRRWVVEKLYGLHTLDTPDEYVYLDKEGNDISQDVRLIPAGRPWQGVEAHDYPVRQRASAGTSREESKGGTITPASQPTARLRMIRPSEMVAGTMAISASLACGGCAEQKRSMFDLQTPRFYVWTHFDPEELRKSLQADGVVVEEKGEGGGLFVVRGTGTLKWPSLEIAVAESTIVANGIQMKSRPDSYRNLVIDKGGRVTPGAFLPFERRFPWGTSQIRCVRRRSARSSSAPGGAGEV